MKMIALTCTQCMAPLDVPLKNSCVQCNYCGTAIHFSTPPDQTEKKEDVKEESEEEIQIRLEIEKLDKEWEAYRRQFLFNEFSGEYEIPDEKKCFHMMVGIQYFGILFSVGFFSIWTIGRIPMGLFLSGIGFILFLVICYLIASKKKKKAIIYQASLEKYHKLRLQLLR